WAGAIVAGVFTAAGGYVVGSVRARRGGATYAVMEIEGDAHERGSGGGRGRGGGNERGGRT
ncbi:glycosyltransferase family 2 protein, partial [Streptomyces prunicolor]|nr:glycosyltransferase family 2 protein [Streptomyces prunicolor]